MRYRKSLVVIIGLWFAAGEAGAVRAQDTLLIENDTDQAANVWFWPRSDGDWLRPPLFLPARTTRQFQFRIDEFYFIAAVDPLGRQSSLWANLTEELQGRPDRPLKLDQIFETRTRTAWVWDCNANEWQQRTFSYRVGRPILDWSENAQPQE